MVKFREKYGGAERTQQHHYCRCCRCLSVSKKWQRNFNIRNEQDQLTCQNLETMCELLVFHAYEQEDILKEVTKIIKETKDKIQHRRNLIHRLNLEIHNAC